MEFEPGQVVGLIRLAGMELELSEIIGRKVDMRTPADLSRYFREEVLSAAEVQYASFLKNLSISFIALSTAPAFSLYKSFALLPMDFIFSGD